MKKTLKLFIGLAVILSLCFSVLPFGAAAVGSASIGFSKRNVTVGDTVTVSVTVSAGEMYAINLSGNYSENVLTYISGASQGGAGIFQIVEELSGEASKTFSITFKAARAGSASISVKGQTGAGIPPVDVDVAASATLSVKDVTLSNNANLKSLTVNAGSLSPKFSANTTAYTVNVKNSITDCKVYGTTADPNATISITGSSALKVGENKRVLTVTAPSGAQKSYTINIIRSAEPDPNEETTSSEIEVPSALETIIDGNSFVVLSDITDVALPQGFDVTKRLYNNEEVSVAVDTKGIYELFYLKQSGSNEAYPYTYDENANAFTRILIINQMGKAYIVAEIEEGLTAPEGYTKKSFEVDGMTVEGYRSNDSDFKDMYYIYCYADGDFSTYRYDAVEKVLQRSPEFKLVEIEEEQTDNKLELFNRFVALSSNAKTIVVCLIILFLGMIALLVLVIVKLFKRNTFKDFDADDNYDDDFDSVTFDDDYKIEEDSNTDSDSTNE